MSLDKHVADVSGKCFFQLRQIRQIRRSLDDESAATLVHAFVTTPVDYCNCLLTGVPRSAAPFMTRWSLSVVVLGTPVRRQLQ